MKKIIFGIFVLAIAAAVAVPSYAKADKVDVCHVDEDGLYHLINVSKNALPAHIAHNDGLPEEPVPGMSIGYYFTDECGVTFITPFCQGFEDSQGCWHKGEPSQNCTTVCSSFGGVIPPTCQYSWKQGYNALTHFFPGASYHGQDWIGIGYFINSNQIFTSGGWNAHCGLVHSTVINVCPCAY